MRLVQIRPRPPPRGSCLRRPGKLLLSFSLTCSGAIEQIEALGGRQLPLLAGLVENDRVAVFAPRDFIARAKTLPFGNGPGNGDLVLRCDLTHILTLSRKFPFGRKGEGGDRCCALLESSRGKCRRWNTSRVSKRLGHRVGPAFPLRTPSPRVRRGEGEGNASRFSGRVSSWRQPSSRQHAVRSCSPACSRGSRTGIASLSGDARTCWPPSSGGVAFCTRRFLMPRKNPPRIARWIVLGFGLIRPNPRKLGFLRGTEKGDSQESLRTRSSQSRPNSRSCGEALPSKNFRTAAGASRVTSSRGESSYHSRGKYWV